MPNYLARREVLELCNYVFLASGLTSASASTSTPAGSHQKSPQPFNLANTTRAFEDFVAGRIESWHPAGEKNPHPTLPPNPTS